MLVFQHSGSTSSVIGQCAVPISLHYIGITFDVDATTIFLSKPPQLLSYPAESVRISQFSARKKREHVVAAVLLQSFANLASTPL
jgi:hypothetical protein